jgi:uncharacterized protein
MSETMVPRPGGDGEEGLLSGLQQAVDEFLASDGIAVVGVSRDTRQAANAIYRKLRDNGARVIAVNPRAAALEGDPCYPDLKSIPGEVQAALIVAPPAAARDLVRQCHARGIGRVWIHATFGLGSVSAEAVAFCRENDIRVIAGACPMMFLAPVDGFHRCLRTLSGWFGRLPKG